MSPLGGCFYQLVFRARAEASTRAFRLLGAVRSGSKGKTAARIFDATATASLVPRVSVGLPIPPYLGQVPKSRVIAKPRMEHLAESLIDSDLKGCVSARCQELSGITQVRTILKGLN